MTYHEVLSDNRSREVLFTMSPPSKINEMTLHEAVNLQLIHKQCLLQQLHFLLLMFV